MGKEDLITYKGVPCLRCHLYVTIVWVKSEDIIIISLIVWGQFSTGKSISVTAGPMAL